MSHLIYRHFEPRSALSSVSLLLVIPSLLSRLISYTGRSPYTAVPLAFTTYGGALMFFTLVYRLSPFHPLAKYPGPVIAKTSKWWAAYYVSSRGDLHRYCKRLHDRYGDVVRIGRGPWLPFCYLSTYPLPGPNELSLRDASLIHSVLGQGGLPKGPRVYMSSLHPLSANM